MAEIRKSVSEWEAHFDTFVMDGDGFPKGTTRESMFTEQEFVRYCVPSTIRFSPKILSAMDALRG